MITKPAQESKKGNLQQIITSTVKTSLAYTALKIAVPLIPHILKASLSPTKIVSVVADKNNLSAFAFVTILSLPVKVANYLTDDESSFISFATAFLSSLGGFSIEKKTKLVEFVVLSVCSRSLFAIFNMIQGKMSASDNTKRCLAVTIFLTLCASIIAIGVLHKECFEIKKLFDGYADFSIWDKRQVDLVRRILNVM